MCGNNMPIVTPRNWAPVPVDLVVAVPAHNERKTIGPCLRSVLAAVERGIIDGCVTRAVVVVGAHRCQDGTEGQASAALGQAIDQHVRHRVIRDNDSSTVGQVRARLIRSVAQDVDVNPTAWIFNTDADSVVPRDWISATVRQAEERGAVAVAGMVAVTGWVATASARNRYRELIKAGITDDGHRHVYGANLAVRYDAYLAVGGFASEPHGEDQGLVDRLRQQQLPLLTTFAPLVLTSGRTPGRAAAGLGHLLGRLAT